jgi:arginine decarboxylase
MKIKYQDFIHQTYDFPQEEFDLKEGELQFHGVSLMELVRTYGTPFKFSYLPKISENIQRARQWFADAIKKTNYQGKYHYAYCTKSSHFKFVMEEVLKNEVLMETSYTTDLQIVEHMVGEGRFPKSGRVLCNGCKTQSYVERIARMRSEGYSGIMPVLDGPQELQDLEPLIDAPCPVGIRIAAEEEPKFEFYTSRLGMGYKDIVPFYKAKIQDHPYFRLEMLHFFINTGIKDTAYYWNEFFKCLQIYVKLKRICPELKSFNIGGGFPIKNSLAFEYDYAYIIEEIVRQIQEVCRAENVPEPDLITEFGSFTVGESGGAVYHIHRQKRQNDKERWNMIDSSFMTDLPDAWAISRRFILLPLHRWDEEYERVFLGGLTCDSDDYYNSEQHLNAIFLPKYSERRPLYIGFFHTGAYQESLGGYGGLKHCLIPHPKHILINRDENGNISHKLFAEEQNPEQMLKLIGYHSTNSSNE